MKPTFLFATTTLVMACVMVVLLIELVTLLNQCFQNLRP